MTLKRNSAPAANGITAEHLVHGADRAIIRHIADMLTVELFPMTLPTELYCQCHRNLVVTHPFQSFEDLLSYLARYQNFLEMYVLEESNSHEYHELQFGFIPGRGTEITTALFNGVTTYCNARSSAVYTCSIDAEGALDAIPASILFNKAAAALHKHCWHVMHSWYSRLTIQVKWRGKLSRTFSVCVSTRQGGLSSPFLFIIFYHNLISILSNCTGGITIHNKSYNVFCYADNLIISSLSVSGLQDMINAAKSYIVEHGLNFNPTNTICKIFGTCNFEKTPKLHLNG